jgi:hypothetical protein
VKQLTTTIRRVKQWWKRHTVVVAIVFAAVSVLLGSAVAVQAVMLHAQGWRLQWQTCLDGYRASALLLRSSRWASPHWRGGLHGGDQARLIIVEPAGKGELEPWGLPLEAVGRIAQVGVTVAERVPTAVQPRRPAEAHTLDLPCDDLLDAEA